MKMLKITLKRSLIGMHGKNKKIVRSLGLKRINQSVLQKNNPAIRGMVDKVRQYVQVEEVEV